MERPESGHVCACGARGREEQRTSHDQPEHQRSQRRYAHHVGEPVQEAGGPGHRQVEHVQPQGRQHQHRHRHVGPPRTPQSSGRTDITSHNKAADYRFKVITIVDLPLLLTLEARF